MSLQIQNPVQLVERVTDFIQTTFEEQGKDRALVAVSGGIDSAVSLTLTVQALGRDRVTALFLPYGDQSIEDSQAIVAFNQLPVSQQQTIQIEPMVDQFISQLNIAADKVRRGNVMARCRMIALFDTARTLDALVVGTENKSEKLLGYFTRYGDEASDIEPIHSLYKTQVRQLADHLGLPQQLINKAPSAGLWQGQTDEEELGFTYYQADQILQAVYDLDQKQESLFDAFSQNTVKRVLTRVEQTAFKHKVPYSFE